MIKKYLGLSLITASMLVMGCSSDDDGPGTTTGTTTGSMDTLVTVPPTVTLPEGVVPTENIVELANTAGLTTLASSLVTAALDQTLADPDSTFTVFAPTDAAFAAEAGLASLTETELAAILQNHVVVGALDADLVAASVGMNVDMLAGDDLMITADAEGALSIGGAAISGTNNYATNGIVHLIDSVILPAPEVDTDGDTVVDSADNCPAVANTDQADADSNGVGDACEPGDTTGDTTGVTDPIGAGEQALIDNGNTTYVDAFLPTGQFDTQNFTDSAWTIFAPSNAALAGTTLTKAQIDNSINTNGTGATNAPLTPADLVDGSTLNMFGGATPMVTNDGTTITVGGFPVTVIYQGTAIIYSIEGIL